MKKAISLLIMSAFVLSCFAGCKKAENNPKESESSIGAIITQPEISSEPINEIESEPSNEAESEIPDQSEPSNKEIKELFEKATTKLVEYAVDEPVWVFGLDFGHENVIRIRTEINDHPYCKTTLNYQQLVNKYSEFFTGDVLNRFLSQYFYELDGVVYVTAIGGASGFGITNVKVTYISQSNGEFLYKATFNRTDFEDVPESQFFVKKTGDGYRLSDTDFFPADWY